MVVVSVWMRVGEIARWMSLGRRATLRSVLQMALRAGGRTRLLWVAGISRATCLGGKGRAVRGRVGGVGRQDTTQHRKERSPAEILLVQRELLKRSDFALVVL